MNEQKLPEWTLEDAYGDVDNPLFITEYRKVESLIEQLQQRLIKQQSIALTQVLPIYEEGVSRVSSLISFCRCLSSQNIHDNKIPPVIISVQKLQTTLEHVASPIFQALYALPQQDPLWDTPELHHWHFITAQKQKSWLRKFTPEQKQQFDLLSATNFYPLNSMYAHINKRIKIQATTDKGEPRTLTLSQCQGIMKGVPDHKLRASTFEGMNHFYQQNADLYADILNQLQGFRLTHFHIANCDYLSPSLEQNRISHDALAMMFNCLQQRIDEIRRSVSLRSRYLNIDAMPVYDLMAPLPSTIQNDIPYPEALANICTGLEALTPELPEFIKFMLDKRWIEARVNHNKVGGAFYVRFNQLKQTRVFTSYMGSFTHQIQQAHELGHAWHYWIMRDLPSIETEFPMTLAEVASTFNEAMVRQYLRQQNENDKTAILWQELKSAANFLLHIPVRYEFETQFLHARQTHILTVEQINQIMDNAWVKWYGETTLGTDRYLWASKQHFYKTDQYIYNYPYTVGYLISQGLMHYREQLKDEFITRYKALLRDTGRLTVDDLIKKHLGCDITQPEFWHNCIDAVMVHLSEFEKQISNPHQSKGSTNV